MDCACWRSECRWSRGPLRNTASRSCAGPRTVRSRGRSHPTVPDRRRPPTRRRSRAGSQAGTGCAARRPACGARSRSCSRSSGLPGTPAPVSGSIRISEPLSPSGSDVVRMSCERSFPPSAVGGDIAPPTPPGGSPQGLIGFAVLPVVGERVARSLPAGEVEVAVRAELEPAAGVARVLLAPVLDQDLLRRRSSSRRSPAGARCARSPRIRPRCRPGGRGPRSGPAGPSEAPCRRSRRRARSTRRRTAPPGSSGPPRWSSARGRGSCGPWCAGRRTAWRSCRRGW